MVSIRRECSLKEYKKNNNEQRISVRNLSITARCYAIFLIIASVCSEMHIIYVKRGVVGGCTASYTSVEKLLLLLLVLNT